MYSSNRKHSKVLPGNQKMRETFCSDVLKTYVCDNINAAIGYATLIDSRKYA